MKTASILQTVLYNTSANILYNLFMDQKKHSKIIQSKVKMSKKIKGTFEVFDGYCHGYNIELLENSKITQAWHFAEDGWPDDHFSICTFKFLEINSANKTPKTKLIFSQTQIPAHKVSSLKEGWKKYYWDAIKNYLKP
jgi:activator of HSP90 ATPase